MVFFSPLTSPTKSLQSTLFSSLNHNPLNISDSTAIFSWFAFIVVTKMFDSALELISEAASNSLFVFCCCNLIIVMILMGSKPSCSFEQGRQSCIPVETNTDANGIQVPGRNNYCMHSVDEFKVVSNVEEEEEENVADDDDREESSNFANDKKEDDEFRKRIEEFIYKVNSGWRAELLRTSDLL